MQCDRKEDEFLEGMKMSGVLDSASRKVLPSIEEGIEPTHDNLFHECYSNDGSQYKRPPREKQQGHLSNKRWRGRIQS